MWPLWCCCRFLKQEILLTLLQSTQLFKWGHSGLVSAGEAAQWVPGVNWGSKCQLCIVSVGLWVPTPLPVRHGTASCWLLALPGGFASTDSQYLSSAQVPQH